MQSRTTAQSAYRCDTELLIREILDACEALWAATARRPCTLLAHRLDEQALITAPIGRFGPVISIRYGDGQVFFREMAVHHDAGLPPGIARLEICDGCMAGSVTTGTLARCTADPRGASTRL